VIHVSRQNMNHVLARTRPGDALGVGFQGSSRGRRCHLDFFWSRVRFFAAHGIQVPGAASCFRVFMKFKFESHRNTERPSSVLRFQCVKAPPPQRGNRRPRHAPPGPARLQAPEPRAPAPPAFSCGRHAPRRKPPGV
jgi:hypothetical protein